MYARSQPSGAWRNRFVHLEYRADLSKDERQGLIEHENHFKEEFGGIEMSGILARFDANLPPTLSNLSVLIAATHRLTRDIDAHLLYLQTGQQYAVALMRYLLNVSPDRVSLLEKIFFRGGSRAAGHVLARFLENGANHSSNRFGSAPSLTRKELGREPINLHSRLPLASC